MKTIINLLSNLSAVMGIITILKIPPGITSAIMWLPKLWAGAWSSAWGLAGGVGALYGWIHNDRKMLWTGLLGASLCLYYTRRVTQSQDAQFAQVFGPDWEAHIPASLRTRLAAKRYTLIQSAPPPVPGQRDVVIERSADFHKPLLCDVWEPPTGTPRSGLAIIYLHGGLWQALDKDFLTQPLFRRLCGQGHVIMDVAYSLSPDAQLDIMLGDVREAILWMKKHAARFAIDPQRIVLMGVSGGAHLALLTAYALGHPVLQNRETGTDPSVRAVVSISGITDMEAYFREYGRMNPLQPQTSAQINPDLRPYLHTRTRLDKFLTRSRLFPAYRHANMPGGALLLLYLMGGTPQDQPEAYRLGSPINHVGPHCPPTLHIHAGDDIIVDNSQGRRLHLALRMAGVPSIYIEIPHAVHAFDQYFGVSRRIAPAAQSVTYDLERFLALLAGWQPTAKRVVEDIAS